MPKQSALYFTPVGEHPYTLLHKGKGEDGGGEEAEEGEEDGEEKLRPCLLGTSAPLHLRFPISPLLSLPTHYRLPSK